MATYGKPCVTKHSKERTKERLGLSKKLTEKNAEKALKYGVTHAELTGRLKRYADSIFLEQENANNMRFYHRAVYVFQGQKLITLFPVPNRLVPLADKAQKKKDKQLSQIGGEGK